MAENHINPSSVSGFSSSTECQKICVVFKTTGRCAYGEGCRFVHHRATPTSSPIPAPPPALAPAMPPAPNLAPKPAANTRRPSALPANFRTLMALKPEGIAVEEFALSDEGGVFIRDVLCRPGPRRRLPVFTEICSDDDD